MARRRRIRTSVPAVEPSPDDDLFEEMKEWFRKARDHSHKWRIEAALCYDFVAGDQWAPDDAAVMMEQNRPIITFNRTSSVVDSVSGLEIANRQEVRFIPRQVGSSGVNELLTSAAKWIRDECGAEDEESDAFMDEIICGVGCTESRIDYDEDPDGKVWVLRVDPLEMYVDGGSRRGNFVDARHIFRVRDVPIKVGKEMFPDVDEADIDAVWARDTASEAKDPHDAQEAPYYRNDQSGDTEKTANNVTLVEVQWWELKTGYRVADPLGGEILTLDAEEHTKLQDRAKLIGLNLTSVPFKTRKYRRAFLGSKILKNLEGPEKGGFTYKFMTAKRDRNHGTWYGLVRSMIDPQRWANKWLAQVMHIINTNAKGGVLAEASAFDNPQEAMETWSDPAAITLVTDGALTGGKIEPKPIPQYPQGIQQLMQFAISSIRDVSGVNLELLGMAAVDQPGIVEHQRKQAGMTILAGMFDSLRQYRKEQGKLLLWFITTFISDGRLIRIGGPQEAQYVPLVHEEGTIEYDVIVDDTPASANMKEQTWAVLMQMMPFLAKAGMPMPVWMEVLKQSPLPSSFVEDVKQILESQQQQGAQQPDPATIQAQAKAESEKARAQWHTTQAQAEAMRAQADVVASQAQHDVSRANAFQSYSAGILNLSKAGAAQMGGEATALEALMSAIETAWQNSDPSPDQLALPAPAAEQVPETVQ